MRFRDNLLALTSQKKGIPTGKTSNQKYMDIKIPKNTTHTFKMWLKNRKTIDKSLHKDILSKKEKWKQVLKIVIHCILLCGRNNLALRGSSDGIGTPQSGNFFYFIELISHTTYFSYKIRNEVIHIIGEIVRNRLLGKIKKAHYHSVMFDCTRDVTREEKCLKLSDI